MREFRFAWNGRVMNRKDTRMILFTIAFAMLGVIGTVVGLVCAATGD